VANIPCDDRCPDCLNPGDENERCKTDFTACGFSDIGEEPQFEANPYKLSDGYEYTFWGRKEFWVCHIDGPNNVTGDELSQFTGSPYINCLSDNEALNAVREGTGTDAEYPIANPGQVFFYAGIRTDTDSGKRIMDVQDYDFCAVKQGEFHLQEISF